MTAEPKVTAPNSARNKAIVASRHFAAERCAGRGSFSTKVGATEVREFIVVVFIVP